MRVQTSLLALALIVASPFSRARADDADDPLAGLSGKRALELAKELSSDAMKGRKTGFPSGVAAEDWVAGQFLNIGLDPMDPDGDYREPFPLSTVDVVAPIGLSIDGAVVDYGPGFTHLLYTGAGTVEAEVVFVGYGISAPARGWDDYAGVDVKGKIVLAIRGLPTAREGDFGDEKFIGWKSALARDRGAVGFLIAEGKSPVPGTIIPKFARQDLPAVWVAEAVADKILAKQKTTFAEAKKSRDAGAPGTSFATGVKARLEVHATFVPNATGRNALAGIRGSDPDLRNEVIVVGAHLDHLGVDPMGRVFNGADDNASGTATLLMLAETLTKNGWRPKRTVVFCGFAAEEQGLAGSKALAANPPFPHTAIVAMLNMDQTGQGTTDVNVAGAEAHPTLWKKIKEALPEPLRKTIHEGRAGENSDHWPFLVRGVPSFFVATAGEHPNYHQVTDDVENLKPECMEAAARFVGRMLVALGEDENPIAPHNGLADYLLHEGVRVVEGPASFAALERYTLSPKSTPAALLREPFDASGWTCVVLDAPERAGSAPGDEYAQDPLDTMRSLDVTAGAFPTQFAVTRSASDLTNAFKGGRCAALPRLHRSATGRAGAASLSALREAGLRWIDPFDAKAPPTDAERDALLDEAAAAKVVVDLTSLPPAMLPAARARLKDRPATCRLVESGKVPSPSSEQIGALRKTLGPSTLLVTSSPGAATLLLTAAALGAPPDPALAPVVLACEDTKLLEALLSAAIAEAGGAWEDPEHPVRARIRALFGGAWVDLLRRL